MRGEVVSVDVPPGERGDVGSAAVTLARTGIVSAVGRFGLFLATGDSGGEGFGEFAPKPDKIGTLSPMAKALQSNFKHRSSSGRN